MAKIHKKRNMLIIILTFVLILIVAFSMYRSSKIKLFDKSTYSSLYKNLEEASKTFTCQKDMRLFITDWADTQNLNYTVDDTGNIIFVEEAISKKKSLSPTVVVVNYNYENAEDNAKSLASAAIIAATDINSSKTYVIFVNNENNNGYAYSQLDQKIFSDNSKVIFLDYGKNMYVSTKSFACATQRISIPTDITSVKCDTAIKIKVKGLKTDCIDTSIYNRTNPIMLLSTILTRLKSKSTICQISDIKFGNKGLMYPDSLEVTVLLNSYSVDAFTKYLDKRVDAFYDKIGKDEGAEYSYKILKKKNMPKKAYTHETFDAITTLLYTIHDGTERLDKDSVIPDDYEIDDIDTIIAPNQMVFENSKLYLDVYTQAVNSDYLNKATKDNAIAAKLSGCEILESNILPAFSSKHMKLARNLQQAYIKVNNMYGDSITLKLDADTYFTSMSYLHKINPSLDIVHVKENSKTANVITNMIICYIQTRGNFFSL